MCLSTQLSYFAFGNYLEDTPRIQIYEEIICQDYYSDIGNSLFYGRDCKVKAVQEELGLIRGVEIFTHLAPSIVRSLSVGSLLWMIITDIKHSYTRAPLRVSCNQIWSSKDFVPCFCWLIAFRDMGAAYLQVEYDLATQARQLSWQQSNGLHRLASKSLPIRLLWTQWVWELMGGGVCVGISMIYLIVADIKPEESRYAKIVFVS